MDYLVHFLLVHPSIHWLIPTGGKHLQLNFFGFQMKVLALHLTGWVLKNTANAFSIIANHSKNKLYKMGKIYMQFLFLIYSGGKKHLKMSFMSHFMLHLKTTKKPKSHPFYLLSIFKHRFIAHFLQSDEIVNSCEYFKIVKSWRGLWSLKQSIGKRYSGLSGKKDDRFPFISLLSSQEE